MGMNKSLNKLETMMDWNTLVTVLLTLHRRLERQRRDINTLHKRLKKSGGHQGAGKEVLEVQEVQEIQKVYVAAKRNISRWHQAMRDVQDSPFAKDVGRHVLARELMRQREAAADSPMKEMKAMKGAKKAVSVAINATGAMKAMKAMKKTKAMKAMTQTPKKETTAEETDGSDSSSGSDSGSDSG